MIDKKQTLPPKTGFPSQYVASLKKCESLYNVGLSQYETNECKRIENETQYNYEYLQRKIEELNKQINSAENSVQNISFNNSKEELLPLFMLVGGIIGFFGFCAVCNNGGYISCFSIGCIFDGVLIGAILGGIVISITGRKDKENANKMKQHIDSRVAEYKKEIESIKMQISKLSLEEKRKKKELEKEVKKAKEEYQDKINKAKLEYEQEFERRVKNLSIKYIESDLIKEKRLVEWIMEGFGSHIDTADRNNYQKSVSVPYKFSVYTNKITCARGTFDFYTHRCQNFEYPEQQAAIASVIANELKIRTVMNYPKNIKDSETMVTYDIQYINNAVVEVTLTYSAINGNYKPLSSWG